MTNNYDNYYGDALCLSKRKTTL